MRDHVLLQAIARVNRPHADADGRRKRIGLVVDFVGVLRELRKALQFDSSDVSGVIEDLDLLLEDFLDKIEKAKIEYLETGGEGGADERLEKMVYGRFLDPEPRRAFFENYKEIEALWEILSPSAELRDHITTFKRLAQLHATVRNAYANRVGYVADLAYKTKRLVEESAAQDGLGRLTKSVTFDVPTLAALRDEPGSDEAKVFNLVRGLQQEVENGSEMEPVLRPLKDRADLILKGLEERTTTGLAAMDLLAALAQEKEAAIEAAKDSGLSTRAFGVYWALKDDAGLSDRRCRCEGLGAASGYTSPALSQRGRQRGRAEAATGCSLSATSATGRRRTEPRCRAHHRDPVGRRRRCGRVTNGARPFVSASSPGRDG